MKQENIIKNKMLGGLWGAVVGDALGVPVEFKSRDEVRRDPVTGMRGFGTFNLPAGSWSDDSSLLLCTVESLVNGFDLKDIADRFIRWKYEGLWTPHGTAFDIGNATAHAINRLRHGVDPEESGGNGENDNGNGSLMHILPVAVAFHDMEMEEFLGLVHAVSSITHRHPRSLVACGIYCVMARYLMEGEEPADACKRTIEAIPGLYNSPPFNSELPAFRRILGGNIQSLPEDAVRSSGYVLHTLEASLWCLLTTGSYGEAVLKAVNLGEDTDTTGCVTGGLAGLHYGLKGIPEEWINAIARKNDIKSLFERLTASIKD
jgi:ADP-ribosylglycohydrolase